MLAARVVAGRVGHTFLVLSVLYVFFGGIAMEGITSNLQNLAYNLIGLILLI